jgi:hypothetical protein
MSPVTPSSAPASGEPLSFEQRIMSEAEESLRPASTPTPGRYYQIRKNDSLLVVAGKAYGVGSGSKRLDLARRINRHPVNARYLRKDKATDLFPEGLLSFLPRFSCDVRAQIKAEDTVPGGKCYGVIWIPPAEEAVHPVFGKAHDVPAWLVADLWKGQPPAALPEEGDAEPSATPARRPKTTLKLIPSTALAPYRFICSLQMFFPRPSLDPDSGSESSTSYLLVGPATGTLIGHRHVLTAGHVLYAEQELTNPPGKLIFKDPLVVVTPGEDSPFKETGVPAGMLPYLRRSFLGNTLIGRFWTWDVRMPRRWRDPVERAQAVRERTWHLYDYGIIELPQSVGNMKWKSGRFGYWGSTNWGEGTIMTPVANTGVVAGKRVYVSGYPDNPDDEEKYQYVAWHGVAQWEGSGLVTSDEEIPQEVTKQDGRERLGYRIPTEQGHSGSPAWMRFNSEGKTIRKLLAVHSHGGYTDMASSGVLLTSKVMEDINTLKRQRA